MESEKNLLLRSKDSFGLNRLLELDNRILRKVGFAILRAIGQEIFHFKTEEKEICLVILSGKWRISIDKEEFTCERKSVFEQKAYAVYLPSQTEFALVAENEGEIAFCESYGGKRKKVIFISPSEVAERHLGSDNFQRTAFDILHEGHDASFLLVGETISKPGNWSSFPPHKHDVDNMPDETALEELYFFRFQPIDGFGIQRIYSKDRSLDELFLIEDRSVILIPNGYHPVVASPGYLLYYLWVLAGEKRVLRSSFDSTYCWMNNGNR